MDHAAASPAAANDGSTASWADRPVGEIVEFILGHFHEPLRRDLPLLIASARAVEAESRDDALCPTGLGDHLDQILIAVESHLAKEEKILFPLILAGRGGNAFMPVKVMMAEHEDHLANLARTRALTHDFALPENARPSWRQLYRDLEKLEADLRQHIDLENNVLFTRVMGNAGL